MHWIRLRSALTEQGVVAVAVAVAVSVAL